MREEQTETEAPGACRHDEQVERLGTGPSANCVSFFVRLHRVEREGLPRRNYYTLR